MPAPLTPITATISPAWRANSTSRTTVCPPRVTESPDAVSSGAPAGCVVEVSGASSVIRPSRTASGVASATERGRGCQPIACPSATNGSNQAADRAPAVARMSRTSPLASVPSPGRSNPPVARGAIRSSRCSRDDDAHAGRGLHCCDRVEHRPRAIRVELRGRLIEDEQARRADNRRREGDALPLTAGERGDLPLRQMRRPDRFECVSDSPLHLPPRDAVLFEGEGDIIRDARRDSGRFRVLKEHPHGAAHPARPFAMRRAAPRPSPCRRTARP